MTTTTTNHEWNIFQSKPHRFTSDVTKGLYSSCSGTTAKFGSSVAAAAGDQISVKTSVRDHFQRSIPVH